MWRLRTKTLSWNRLKALKSCGAYCLRTGCTPDSLEPVFPPGDSRATPLPARTEGETSPRRRGCLGSLQTETVIFLHLKDSFFVWLMERKAVIFFMVNTVSCNTSGRPHPKVKSHCVFTSKPTERFLHPQNISEALQQNSIAVFSWSTEESGKWIKWLHTARLA